MNALELERRDLPAIIHWTGAAANGAWSDVRNWEGNTLPTASDRVVIAPAQSPNPAEGISAPTAISVFIDSPVVVAGIESYATIRISGENASLRLVDGDSILYAGLDMYYAGLAVQGASTRLEVRGDESGAASGLVVALDGGRIGWNGLHKLDNMVLFVNAGSTIAMPNLTEATNISELTVRGGRFTAPALASFTGGLVSIVDTGTLDVPVLTDASGTFIEAAGAGTRVELPSLSRFDHGRFRADLGSAISAEALRSVVVSPATAWSFSWFIGENSRLLLPNLSTIDVSQPKSSVEAKDARILLRSNGQLQVSSASTTQVTGVLSLALSGDSRVIGSLTLGASTVLTGSGTIVGSLDNSGLISPSGDYSPYGTITVKGDFTNRPGGTIDFQMGSAQKLDRLFIEGRSTIYGGSLKLRLNDEFADPRTPTPTGSFELMKWQSWAGQFTTVPDILPRSDGTGLTSQSRYEPAGLVQVVGQHRTDPDVISVSDITVAEGNSAVSYGIFTIRRNGPMTVPITVGYEVIAGTAKPGVHFTFPNGPITFAPGETERQIRFVIRGNKTYAGDVSFQIRLTSVSERGELGQTLATVKIREDDPAPVKKPVVPKPGGKPAPKPKATPVPNVKPMPKPPARPKLTTLIAARR